ncbi:MAG: DUF3515 domain-containing protein [Nocardioides sp.]|nr:DUF3515 domain-containing protein [Nocardioides sp.]
MSARARGVVACALLVGVTACSADTVHMDGFEVNDATRGTCEDFLEALPSSVHDLDEVEVEPKGSLGRAWGNPAIVAICGVDMPPDFNKFSSCEEANGVGWYIPDEDLADDQPVTMTTIGFDPVVEVPVRPTTVRRAT